jgi:hypothetical protein
MLRTALLNPALNACEDDGSTSYSGVTQNARRLIGFRIVQLFFMMGGPQQSSELLSRVIPDWSQDSHTDHYQPSF